MCVHLNLFLIKWIFKVFPVSVHNSHPGAKICLERMYDRIFNNMFPS